jgi:hypothetical protein
MFFAVKKTTIETFVRSGSAGSLREKTSIVVLKKSMPRVIANRDCN